MIDYKNTAIILLGHGSRVVNAGENMEKVAERLKTAYGFRTIEYCFMSRLGPHFPETLAQLVSNGEKDILVIPYFLHSGLHIVLDIPEMMQAEANKYPEVKLVLGPNLGYDDVLADLVMKRIKEAGKAKDIREIVLPARENFPVPPGQSEFVPMLPEEAEKYLRKHDGKDHH